MILPRRQDGKSHRIVRYRLSPAPYDICLLALLLLLLLLLSLLLLLLLLVVRVLVLVLVLGAPRRPAGGDMAAAGRGGRGGRAAAPPR